MVINKNLTKTINLIFAMLIILAGCTQENIKYVKSGKFYSQNSQEKERYSWRQVRVNGGGVTTFLVVDPHSPNEIYAGANVSGIYKSYDYGENWTPINKGLNWPVDKIAAELSINSKDGTLYLGVGAFGKGGLFRSRDKGESWQLLTREIRFNNVEGVKQSIIAVNPSDSNTLYAGSDKDGLFKSEDGGETWINKGLRGMNISSILIHPYNPEVIYVAAVHKEGLIKVDKAGEGGIFKSTDGGNSWKRAVGDIYNVYHLTMHKRNPDIIYAACGIQGILKTTDGGNTWSTKNNGLVLSNKSRHYVGFISLAIDPNNPEVVYAGSGINKGQIYKSMNGGAQWDHLTAADNIYTDGWWLQERQLLGSTASSVNCLSFDPDNSSRVYSCGRQGIWRSDDSGKSWHAKAQGLETTVMNRVVLDSRQKDVIYIGSSDWLFFYSLNGGNSSFRTLDGMGNWDIKKDYNIFKKYRMKNGRDLAVDPRSTPSTIYIAGDAAPSVINNSGTVFKSLDGGMNWREANNGLPVARISALAINPDNYDVLYAALYTKGIYKTTNGGNSWQAINNGLPAPEGLFENYINEILISPSSSETIYVLDKGNGIYKSVNGGNNWKIISNRLPKIGFTGMLYYSGGLAIDPRNPDTVYVGLYKHGIYKTIDGGERWRKISPPYIINGGTMDIDPYSGTIYITSVPENNDEDIGNFIFGIYKSIDEGKTWNAINNDDIMKITLKIKDLTVDPYSGRIYLATMGNGIIVGEPAP